MGQIISGSIKSWINYGYPQTQAKWDEAYAAAEAYETSTGTWLWLGSFALFDQQWNIYRLIGIFNIPSGLPALTNASIKSHGYWVTEHTASGYMYDATGLSWTSKATYGDIINLAPEKLIGTYEIPIGYSETDIWIATFNSAGLAFLESKKGTNAYIAFWSDEQPSPDGNALRGTYRSVTHSSPSILYYNEIPGYIWVEGTEFAYLDINRDKRTTEGVLTGTTGKTPGYCFVEGDYLHYIDSSGVERRILGSTTGLTGKQPSQISINIKSPMLGTFLCYIDSSGNERCFEGTAA